MRCNISDGGLAWIINSGDDASNQDIASWKTIQLQKTYFPIYIRQIFGEKTEQVLLELRVEFTPFWGYMRVDGFDGHLVVNSRYMNKGDRVDIYLDLIHKLVHVRQFLEGKELWDTRFAYAERLTEIEAYRYAVEEARNLGLSNRRICEYLKTEWMSEEDLRKLAKALNVRCSHNSVFVQITWKRLLYAPLHFRL